MPTTHEYKGKHVRTRGPGIDSLTPRGPERWARAAHNALVNPTSHAAKLYSDRVATARRFLEFEEAKLPFEHVTDEYTGDSIMDIICSSKRKYVTCNIVCAAMQVQLDFGTTEYSDVAAVFSANYRRSYEWRGVRRWSRWQTNVIPLDTSTLTRKVRCQVCGTTVKPGA